MTTPVYVVGHCAHCHERRELPHYGRPGVCVGAAVCAPCYWHWLIHKSVRSHERRAHARRVLLGDKYKI